MARSETRRNFMAALAGIPAGALLLHLPAFIGQGLVAESKSEAAAIRKSVQKQLTQGAYLECARSTSVSEILEVRQEFQKRLSPDQANDLRVVTYANGTLGLVFKPPQDATEIKKALHIYVQIAEDLGLDQGQLRACDSKECKPALHLEYFRSKSWPEAQKYFKAIAKHLGESVQNRLVIEYDQGNYCIRYKRFGSPEGAQQTFLRHQEILSKSNISVSLVSDVNASVVYGVGMSMLDSEQAKDRVQELKTVPKAIPYKPPPKANPAQQSEVQASSNLGSGPLFNQVRSFILAQLAKGKASSSLTVGIKADERVGVMARNLRTGELIVSVFPDRPMQAASMIKPFVAMAYFTKMAERGLGYKDFSKEVKKDLDSMLVNSNNLSTNRIIDRVGGISELNNLLKTKYANIFQGTELIEKIPAGGATYKNTVTIADYDRFMQAMYQEEFPGARDLRMIMSRPKRDRLVDRADGVIPLKCSLASKTGSTARCCGDFGIIQVPGCDPIGITVVVDKASRASSYMSWMHARGEFIAEISKMVYLAVKARSQQIAAS